MRLADKFSADVTLVYITYNAVRTAIDTLLIKKKYCSNYWSCEISPWV
jgi:hypothetical protein